MEGRERRMWEEGEKGRGLVHSLSLSPPCLPVSLSSSPSPSPSLSLSPSLTGARSRVRALCLYGAVDCFDQIAGFSYDRICFLTIECVLLRQNVFSYDRMCSLLLHCFDQLVSLRARHATRPIAPCTQARQFVRATVCARQTETDRQTDRQRVGRGRDNKGEEGRGRERKGARKE